MNVQVAGQAVREVLQEYRGVRRRVTLLALGLELVFRMVALGAGYLGMTTRRGAPLVDNLAVAGVAGFRRSNCLVPVNLQGGMHRMTLGAGSCGLVCMVRLMAGRTLGDIAMAGMAA